MLGSKKAKYNLFTREKVARRNHLNNLRMTAFEK